jgi:hypothetical protein
MNDAFQFVFAVIGAFVIIYAATHNGEIPRLFPQTEAPSHGT